MMFRKPSSRVDFPNREVRISDRRKWESDVGKAWQVVEHEPGFFESTVLWECGTKDGAAEVAAYVTALRAS